MSRRIRIIADHRHSLPLERLAKLALAQARAERQQRQTEAATSQPQHEAKSKGDAA